jgi:carbon starvation protein CstA
VLAAQFGFMPGLLWLVFGVCLAGAVQDSFWLWASTRRGGRSLADIARSDVGPVAGVTAAIAVLLIIVIAMAGLGIIVVNALADSAWGTFTIFMTIPLAVFMGFYMFQWRKGHIREATVFGIIVLFMPSCSARTSRVVLRALVLLSKHQLVIAMGVHDRRIGVAGLDAATPRAYLSTFMKIGVSGSLVIGVMILNPKLEAPAFSRHQRRRANHPRLAVSVSVHHHCLRRHPRVPRHRRVGHHVEDGRQGIRHPADRLRRHARRRRRRHRRAGDGRGASPRRLLRHQHDARGLLGTPHPDRQPAGAPA